jgi:hypothetical protein
MKIKILFQIFFSIYKCLSEVFARLDDYRLENSTNHTIYYPTFFIASLPFRRNIKAAIIE